MNYKEILYKIINHAAEEDNSGFFYTGDYRIYKSSCITDVGMVSLGNHPTTLDISIYTSGTWRLEHNELGTSEVDSTDKLPKWATDFIMQAAVDILGYEETTVHGISGQQTAGACTSDGFYTKADVDEIVSEKLDDSYMDGYNAGRAEAMEEIVDKLLSKKLTIN